MQENVSSKKEFLESKSFSILFFAVRAVPENEDLVEFGVAAIVVGADPYVLR